VTPPPARYEIDVRRYRDALRDAVELPATTRGVLYILAQWMNTDGSNAWPSLTRLAASCQMRERTLAKHLELAVAAGYLHRAESGHRGRTAVYRACIPVYRWDEQTRKLVQPLSITVPPAKAARGCSQTSGRLQTEGGKAAS
jgi:hypothetical protein